MHHHEPCSQYCSSPVQLWGRGWDQLTRMGKVKFSVRCRSWQCDFKAVCASDGEVFFFLSDMWKTCCLTTTFSSYLTFEWKQACEYCHHCRLRRSAMWAVSNWRVFCYKFFRTLKVCHSCNRSVQNLIVHRHATFWNNNLNIRRQVVVLPT